MLRSWRSDNSGRSNRADLAESGDAIPVVAQLKEDLFGVLTQLGCCGGWTGRGVGHPDGGTDYSGGTPSWVVKFSDVTVERHLREEEGGRVMVDEEEG